MGERVKRNKRIKRIKRIMRVTRVRRESQSLLKEPQVVQERHYFYLLAFGSNLGVRERNLQRGLDLLCQCVTLRRCSSWRSTEPLTSPMYDTTDHLPYLNFVCEVECSLPPDLLYERIRIVENSVGHRRDRKWLPRELDIDILFCAIGDGPTFSECLPLRYSFYCDGGELFQIPHVAFWSRSFLVEMVLELGILEETLLLHDESPGRIS